MTETILNVAWRATGQQPMAHTTPLQACVCVYPAGRIQPGLLGDFSQQHGAIPIPVEEFEAIAQRLEDEIMRGKILPESEDEIPHRQAPGKRQFQAVSVGAPEDRGIA